MTEPARLRPTGIGVIPVVLTIVLVVSMSAVTLILPQLPDPAIVAPSAVSWWELQHSSILVAGWGAVALSGALTALAVRRHDAIGTASGYLVEAIVPVGIAATLPGFVAQIGAPITPEFYGIAMGPTTLFVIIAVLISAVVIVAQARGLSRRSADILTRTVRTTAFPMSEAVQPAAQATTEVDAGGAEKYVTFMARSLPREQARRLAEQLLAQVRFHTAYLPYSPETGRLQFVLPGGAMLLIRDSLEHGRRRLDFVYAAGFVQYQSTITYRRSAKEDQASGWFAGPMTDREMAKLLLTLEGIIDTAYKAGKAVREPALPLIDVTTAPTRVV